MRVCLMDDQSKPIGDCVDEAGLGSVGDFLPIGNSSTESRTATGHLRATRVAAV